MLQMWSAFIATCTQMAQFFEDWWKVTWLTLGVLAVVAGAITDRVQGEPVIIALCVAMILLARPGRVARLLTGALVAVGAVLAVAEGGESGLLDRNLWRFLALLVGGSAFIALVIISFRWIFRNDRHPQTSTEVEKLDVEES